MAFAFDERVPHKNHPMMRRYEPSKDWKIGCTGAICYNVTFCVEVMFCMPCAAGYLENNLKGDGPIGMDWTPCMAILAACYICPCACPCVYAAYSHGLRQAAVNRYNLELPKQSCCDKTVGFCCCPCSTCQIAHEIEMRKEFNGSLCTDPSPNYTLDMWEKSKLGNNHGANNLNAQPHQFGAPAPPPPQHAISVSYNNNPSPQSPNPLHSNNQQQFNQSWNGSQHNQSMNGTGYYDNQPPPGYQQQNHGGWNHQPGFAPPPPPPNFASGMPPPNFGHP